MSIGFHELFKPASRVADKTADLGPPGATPFATPAPEQGNRAVQELRGFAFVQVRSRRNARAHPVAENRGRYNLCKRFRGENFERVLVEDEPLRPEAVYCHMHRATTNGLAARIARNNRDRVYPAIPEGIANESGPHLRLVSIDAAAMPEEPVQLHHVQRGRVIRYRVVLPRVFKASVYLVPPGGGEWSDQRVKLSKAPGGSSGVRLSDLRVEI